MSQPITRNTYEDLTTGSKLNVIFDIQQEQCKDIKEIKKTIDNKKFIHKIEAFVGGIIGGVLAVFSKMLIWK